MDNENPCDPLLTKEEKAEARIAATFALLEKQAAEYVATCAVCGKPIYESQPYFYRGWKNDWAHDDCLWNR